MTTTHYLRICAGCIATTAAFLGTGCESTPRSEAMPDSPALIDVEASERLIAQARGQFEAGDIGQASQTLDLAVAANPYDGRLHYNLGVLALRQGNFDTAATRFERAAELMPQSAGPQLGIASTLLQTGRYETAAEAFKRALELDPDNRAASEGLMIALDCGEPARSSRSN